MTRNSNFLRDLGFEIALLARSATAEAVVASDDFALGRAMAFYEIVSLMHQQALAFGLDLEDLGQAGLDPDRDLLVGRQPDSA